PVSALACGLVIAMANRLSAGLSARFVLLSAAVLAQVILNVPATVTLFSHGAVMLGALWFVTPRAIFRNVESEAHAHRREWAHLEVILSNNSARWHGDRNCHWRKTK